MTVFLLSKKKPCFLVKSWRINRNQSLHTRKTPIVYLYHFFEFISINRGFSSKNTKKKYIKEKAMSKKHFVSTKDIYECAFMLTQGAEVEKVEVQPENSILICLFTFSGENLMQAQNDYYNGRANVNLWEFRRCYTRINSLIGTARKGYNTKKVDEVMKKAKIQEAINE